jgi:hypothetical protein
VSTWASGKVERDWNYLRGRRIRPDRKRKKKEAAHFLGIQPFGPPVYDGLTLFIISFK